MANNLIQVKRTSVSGRAANTTTLTNAGELALNMTDGIMYSTNGSVVFEIGANNTNARVSGNLTIKGIIANGSLGTSGYVLKSNGSAAYWDSDSADVGAANQVLYRNSSNVLTSSSGLVYDGVSIKVNGNLESLYNNGSEGGEIFLSKPASGTTLAGTGVTLDIYENKLRIFENGGTNRGAYIDITAASAGVGSNLLSGGGGGGSVNVSAQYAWTNTHSFSANVAFTGNNITIVSNTGSVMFAGAGDTNWRIGRSTGAFTKRFYSNNTLDFIAANSNLEGIAFGYTGSEVYLETGYNGTYTKNPVYIGTVNSTSNGIVVGTTSINIGNSSVNSTINSTAFTGTALLSNNASFLGGTAAASFVQNTDSRTLSGNLTFSGANVTFSGNMRVSGGIFANSSLGTAGQILASNGTSVYWTSDQGANAVTANTLSANYISVSVGTITVGNSTVNTDIGNNYVSVGNSTSYANVYSTFVRIGNSSVTSTINSISLSIGSSFVANATGVYPSSNTSGQNLGSATQRFDAFLDAVDLSGTLTSNTGGNAVVFSNQTSQWIYFAAGGAGAPTNTTRSAGTKVVIWPSLGASTVDYAIGTDNNVLWYSVGQSTASHVWYANTTSIMTANQVGLYHGGTVNAASHTVGSTFVANTTAIYFGTINSTSNGVVVNATSFVVGNSTVNTTINSTSFTGSTTFSGNLVFSGANNTVSGNLTIASTGELIITNGAGIIANGTLGTSGQVLTTNGTSVYWAGASGGFTNGTSISVNNFVLTGAFTANSSNGTAGQFLVSNSSTAYWANAITMDVYYANGSLAFTGSGAPTTVGVGTTLIGATAHSGSNSGIFIPATSNLEFGSGDFTIEFFWYPISTGRQALYTGSVGTDYSIGIDYNSVGTNKLGIWASSTGTSWNIINADAGGNGIGTTTVPQNQWNHIAYVRNGSTWRLYLNGVQEVSVTSSATIISRSSAVKVIGQWFSATAMTPASGFISNFRVIKGQALYTSAFTVPSLPLTATGNTVLLTAESVPPRDRSTGNNAVTGNNISFSSYSVVTSSVTGGATGGGFDKAFYENDITITTNYTLTTNKNAMTAGPITINSGVTVTVPSGSVWTIV